MHHDDQNHAAGGRRRALLAALTLTSAGAAFVLWQGNGGAAPPAAPARAPAVAGQAAAYRVELDSQVGGVAQQVGAHLDVVVHAVEATGAVLTFALDDVVWSLGGQRMTAQELALTAPCRAHLRDGRLEQFEFAEGLPAHVRRQLAGLLRMFQWCEPGTAPAELTDSIGRCVVESRWSGASVVQRKLRYLDTAAGSGGDDSGDLPCSARVLSATATLVPAVDGLWLERAEVQERIELGSDGSDLLPLTQQATLQRTPRRAHAAAPGLVASRAALDAAQDLAAGPAAPPERTATAADRDHFAQRLAAFCRGDRLDIVALHELARLLAEMPELAQLVDAALDRGDVADVVLASLIHVLELAGGDACQIVLIDRALAPHGGDQQRLRAVAAMGGLQRPSVDAELTLQEVARSDPGPLGGAALLALGAMQQRLTTVDAGRAAALGNELVDRLATAPTIERRLLLLRALANSRDPHQQAAVAPLLHDAEPRIRASAATTLAAVAGAAAAPALGELLCREPTATVRTAIGAALAASGASNTQIAQTVAHQLAQETDPQARASLACYLSEHLDSDPGVRPALHRCLQERLDDRSRAVIAGRLLRRAP